MKPWVKKLIKILSNIIVDCLIIITLFIIMIASFSKSNLVLFNKYMLLNVEGNSMYPSIKNGDLILINVEDTNYEVNDVISYYIEYGNEKIIVTHKIMDIDGSEYITKGINNKNYDDYTVTNNDIIGKYSEGRLPLIGYIVTFARTFIGYLLLVVLPVALVTIYLGYEVYKAFKHKKGEV